MKFNLDFFKQTFSLSEYNKNIFSVFKANAFAQFLPFLTAPILTRIYSPQDYGYFGIILSIVGLVGVFATLSYSNAILVAENDEEALSIIKLCLKICLYCALLISVVIVLLQKQIAALYNIEKIQYVIFIVPFAIVTNTVFAMFELITIRQKEFKTLSICRITNAIITAIISILIGVVFKTVLGLILGFFIGIVCANLLMYIRLKENKLVKLFFEQFKFNTSLVAKKYSNFPKFTLFSDFINIFNNQIPIYILNMFSSNPQAAIGNYNMSNRMLGMPSSLISNSIAEVFKQRAIEDYQTLGTCRDIFLKTFKTLLLYSVVPFFVLIIWGGDIFAFVFGEKWRASGHYSQILGIMFFFRFTISPLTYVFFVASKQKLDLVLHILFILLSISSLIIGFKIFKTVEASLWFFSICYSLVYIMYFIFSYRFTINHAFKLS